MRINQQNNTKIVALRVLQHLALCRRGRGCLWADKCRRVGDEYAERHHRKGIRVSVLRPSLPEIRIKCRRLQHWRLLAYKACRSAQSSPFSRYFSRTHNHKSYDDQEFAIVFFFSVQGGFQMISRLSPDNNDISKFSE